MHSKREERKNKAELGIPVYEIVIASLLIGTNDILNQQ
jgi:hypothetical protein